MTSRAEKGFEDVEKSRVVKRYHLLHNILVEIADAEPNVIRKVLLDLATIQCVENLRVLVNRRFSWSKAPGLDGGVSQSRRSLVDRLGGSNHWLRIFDS